MLYLLFCRLDMDQTDRQKPKENGSASDREAAIRDYYEFEGTFFRVCNNISSTMGATCGAGLPFRSTSYHL